MAEVMFKLAYILSKYLRLLSGWNFIILSKAFFEQDFLLKLQKNWWFRHSEAVGLALGFSDNIGLINEINSYYILLVSPAFLMASTAFSHISR